MPTLLRGTTTSIPKDAMTAPGDNTNEWEVWHSGTLLAASHSIASGGWNVAPDPSLTDYYLITVPLSAPASTGNAYQFRYGTATGL